MLPNSALRQRNTFNVGAITQASVITIPFISLFFPLLLLDYARSETVLWRKRVSKLGNPRDWRGRREKCGGVIRSILPFLSRSLLGRHYMTLPIGRIYQTMEKGRHRPWN